MAQSAWVAMTREMVQRQSANRTGPRVDAGVTELSEMTIGRTDDPENPILATAGQPGRVIVWGWIAEPIWASGQPAAPTGRTHGRNRTARQISSSSLLHPRGRPHMREAQRRSNPHRRASTSLPRRNAHHRATFGPGQLIHPIAPRLILLGTTHRPRHSLRQMKRPIRPKPSLPAGIAPIRALATAVSTTTSNLADCRICPAC
jgi:hypothetical protein